MTGLRPIFSGVVLLVTLACDSASTVDPATRPPGNPPVGLPGLTLSTLIHGTERGGQTARDVAVDAQGNVYVTGGTSDRGFPTTSNAYQRTFGQGKPATSIGSSGPSDVYVMKFSPDGQLVWSTLIGGGNHDRAFAIEVDGSGVYVAGRAGEGFPTTGGVVQPNFAGDDRPGSDGKQDGFIAKLSLDGRSLLWSTYFGGPADEFIRDLAIGPNGDLYPALSSVKQIFAYVGASAFQPTNRGADDGAACRLAAGATAVLWCTFIGGSERDGFNASVRVDGSGNVYYSQGVFSANMPTSQGALQVDFKGGMDQHLTKLSPQGTLVYATYFGGSGIEDNETHNLWVSPSGEVFMAAGTTSTDLPTTAGVVQSRYGGGSVDGFVARFSADGGRLLACTYLGSGAKDEIEGIGMDAGGNVVVTGNTGGAMFAASAGAPQSSVAGGQDGFIVVLPPSLASITRATFLGGGGMDLGRALTVDGPRGVIYIAGDTNSSDFPTLEAAFLRNPTGADVFLAGWRY